MRGRARLCPASSAPPPPHAGRTPDHHQPCLSHFLSSGISPAAAFVAVSFHQGKLTIPSPRLAILGGGWWRKPGRGRDGADEPSGLGSLEVSCNLGESWASLCLENEAKREPASGLGDVTGKSLVVLVQVGKRAVPEHRSQQERPSGSLAEGNAKTLPRVRQPPDRGSTWPPAPAGKDSP